MNGFFAILRKEAIQMMRDRGTLRLSIAIPLFQIVLFGLIDLNVRNVDTLVVDFDHSPQSRLLIQQLDNTSYFHIDGYANSRNQLYDAIVSGRAEVGVEIPPDYSERRLNHQPAQALVLIDGSNTNVASQMVSAANGLALSRSVEELIQQSELSELPIQINPILLFNPGARSAVLLIPGLVAILLTFSGTLLSAYAIVRERERGTLEQLMVTPVSPIAVVLGKLLPYLGLAYLQLLLILVLMASVFAVPIHGNIFLLLGLAFIYLFVLLCLGLLISAWAHTQIEATQIAQMFLLPSIMLSGYIFPLASLPLGLRIAGHLLPATHFIKIARGVIIRGATFADLWQDVLALVILGTILLAASTRAFRKTIS